MLISYALKIFMKIGIEWSSDHANLKKLKELSNSCIKRPNTKDKISKQYMYVNFVKLYFS